MPSKPIQIVLDSSNFIDDWKRQGNSDEKDFFEGRNADFIAHKKSIIDQLEDIKSELVANEFAQVAYAKLTLNPSAIAKSHRPTKALFKKTLAPVVGGGDIGELYVEVSSAAIAQIERTVADAEEVPRQVEKKGELVTIVSPLRSEVGAIETIRAITVADKRNFSISQGLEWLANPLTGGAYVVELFETPPPRKDWDMLSSEKAKLFESFQSGLASFGTGLVASNVSKGNGGASLIGVRLENSSNPARVQLEPTRSSAGMALDSPIATNLNVQTHEKLITFLDKHPLVKRISLPPLIRRSDAHETSPTPGVNFEMPKPKDDQAYPVIAVVDGGISNLLREWVAGENDYLSPDDRDEVHGTNIGSLLVAGNALNGPEVWAEGDGCMLLDLALLPKEGRFGVYYRDSNLEFFSKLSDAIEDIKSKVPVRIFNFSINTDVHVSTKGYSLPAIALDSIANEHDVIFVISAGNTDPIDSRREWPTDETDALSILANCRNHTLKSPAESCRNICVSAVNPPNLKGVVPLAPTNYTCMGPGMRIGIKPDVAHIGGAGISSTGTSGLRSLSLNGGVVQITGTSFAAPQIAKTLACLDHAIEGYTSRETLMALVIHNAIIPPSLTHRKLREVLRNIVGFGVPSRSEDILGNDEHSITLAFAARIYSKKRMQFRFSWPASLVRNGGSCRGAVRLTLVSTPPFDYKYGAEFARVNIDASLRQQEVDEEGEISWHGRLKPVYPYEGKGKSQTEKNLIDNSFKWATTKVFAANMKGKGNSAEWTLDVEYLERESYQMPQEGVPFTVLLTISDNEKNPANRKPVFTEMHQHLTSIGVRLADIQIAARVQRRV